MINILAKRLSFFSQIIVIIWIIAMFAWIQKIEAYDLKNDVLILKALETITTPESNIPIIFDFENNNQYFEDMYFQSTYYNIRKYLKIENQDVFNSITNARKNITEWLEEQGVSKSTLSNLTGKGGNNTIPFYFFDFSENTKNSIAELNKQENMVSDLLNKLEILVKPQKILAVESIIKFPSFIKNYNNRLSEKCIDSESIKPLSEKIEIRIEGNVSPNSQPPIVDSENSSSEKCLKLGSVKLINNKIKITFKENLPLYSQQIPLEEVFDIPVKVRKVDVPSLLLLTDSTRSSNNSLLKLANNEEQKNIIKQTYGLLPLEVAKEIAFNGLVEAYKKINILGFSSSARKFPLAVLFFSFIFMLGTFLTIKEAQKKSLKIISSIHDEKAIDIIIDNKFLRIILWCVLPILSLIMSLPITQLATTEMLIIYLGCIVLLFLGITSTYYSMSL
jgi:hypothetical protein